MLVNTHEAKTQLSRLIAAAEAGEEVIIARRGTPAVKLVPVEKRTFRFGTLAHLVDPETIPDFLAPMSEEELALWEGCPDETEP